MHNGWLVLATVSEIWQADITASNLVISRIRRRVSKELLVHVQECFRAFKACLVYLSETPPLLPALQA